MDVASITAREGALEPRRNILAAKFALQAAPRTLARTHWLAFLFCHSRNCSGLPHGNPLSQNWTHARTDRRAGALLFIHQKRSRDPSRAEMARAISTY